MIAITLNLCSSCNLSCTYCFNSDLNEKPSTLNLEEVKEFLTSLEGKATCHLTGGEPLMVNGSVEFISWLIENNNKVVINTNLTCNIDKVLEIPGIRENLTLLPSFHIRSLEEKGLIKKWLENYSKVSEVFPGAEVFVVAHPSISKEESLDIRDKYGEVNYVYMPFIGTYKGKTFPESYSPLHLDYFNLEEALKIFNEAKGSKGMWCNAGSGYISVNDKGCVFPCLKENVPIGSISKGVRLKDKLIRCRHELCPCPELVNKYREK
jgi:molybdenum cofactor biosynthesis enzyme MoaA